MPQMSPMSWTSLFISFVITLMMFNSMIYFITKKKNELNKKFIKIKEKNWMW